METPDPLVAIAKQLQALDHREIRAWLKRGQLLTEAQALCAPDGAFVAWLSRHAIPKRTAYKAINAWRDFGGVPTSARFTKEAMDILSTHTGALAECIERSKRERIGSRIARQVIAAHWKKVGWTSPLTKKEAKQASRKITGPGFTLTISFDHVPVESDLLSAALHAVSVLREEMKLSQRAA